MYKEARLAAEAHRQVDLILHRTWFWNGLLSFVI